MENIRFEFDAKKHMKPLVFVCVMTGVVTFYNLTINIIGIINNSIINLSHWSMLNTIVFLIFFIIISCFTFYGYRYKVKIINNTLYIRLMFNFKDYDLTTIEKYSVRPYGKNKKFLLYFSNKKRRTIVTVKKDPLVAILNEYIKDDKCVKAITSNL